MAWSRRGAGKKNGAGLGPWPTRHPAGAVRIRDCAGCGRSHGRKTRITGAGLDPSGTPAGFPSNGSGGEGCWGEAADAEPNVVVAVAGVVAVPVGRAAVVGFVEPGAAAQQLGDPPMPTYSLRGKTAGDLPLRAGSPGIKGAEERKSARRTGGAAAAGCGHGRGGRSSFGESAAPLRSCKAQQPRPVPGA